MFTAKIVEGRDENGTVYKNEVYSYNMFKHAVQAAVEWPVTTDIFDDERGDVVARVHVDGGVDVYRKVD